jgi:hypothetical protein
MSVMGLRMTLPSMVVTTSWLFSTVTRRTVLMSRWSSSPLFVMMTSRCCGAADAGAAGSAPPEGCAAGAGLSAAALSLEDARAREPRAPLRRGAGRAVAVAAGLLSVVVSPPGFASAVAPASGFASGVSTDFDPAVSEFAGFGL